MLVRAINDSDASAWERMRQLLWPSVPGEHAGEIARFFSGDRRNPAEVLLAIDERGRAIGFAELSIRPYAEGCDSGRIAYLEGWFVESSARRQGVGAALVKAAEEWGVISSARNSRLMPNSRMRPALSLTKRLEFPKSFARSVSGKCCEPRPDARRRQET